MKQFAKIFQFELLGYLKNKIFVIMTALLVAAVAIALSIPNILAFFKNDNGGLDASHRPIMLLYAEQSSLAQLAKQYFENAFADYTVTVYEGTLDGLQEEIISENAQCAFALNDASSYTYYVNNLAMQDQKSFIATEVLKEVCRANAMIAAGLTPEQAAGVMSVQIKSDTVTLGKDQFNNFFYTYILIFALYMVILLYGQMVATNVASEKSSRAMELLITSAKPVNMMFGKVLASGLAGFMQISLILGSGFLFYNLNKESIKSSNIISSIFDVPANILVYMLIFFVLGFMIYAFLYGAMGSTVSKLEDIQTMVMPITFLFISSFIVPMISMSSGSVDNTLMKVLSFIPFTSPIAMFTRIAMSTVAWYEIAACIAILIISTAAVGFVSAKIYRAGVLLYGAKPNIASVVKSVFKA